MLIHDRDKKFCAEFRYVLRNAGVRDVPVRIHTPNMNAHAERVIQTLKHECLDRFIVMGTKHLDHLTSEFTRHYNLERPHSRLGMRTPLASNETIAPWTVPREKAAANLIRRERLGGLLRHYVRLAA